MKQFRFFIDTGFAGCEHEMFMTLDNEEATQEALEQCAQDFLEQMIYVGWEEIDCEEEE